MRPCSASTSVRCLREVHGNHRRSKKMTPNWFDWPVHEQYIDFAVYPLHNENCFNQTTVPAACYWFWLHTRPEAGK